MGAEILRWGIEPAHSSPQTWVAKKTKRLRRKRFVFGMAGSKYEMMGGGKAAHHFISRLRQCLSFSWAPDVAVVPLMQERSPLLNFVLTYSALRLNESLFFVGASRRAASTKNQILGAFQAL